jgi:hypothetical protein
MIEFDSKWEQNRLTTARPAATAEAAKNATGESAAEALKASD